jgi:hypothetical protein
VFNVKIVFQLKKFIKSFHNQCQKIVERWMNGSIDWMIECVVRGKKKFLGEGGLQLFEEQQLT